MSDSHFYSIMMMLSFVICNQLEGYLRPLFVLAGVFYFIMSVLAVLA